MNRDTISRRTFLKQGLQIAVIGGIGGGVLAGCRGLRRSDLSFAPDPELIKAIGVDGLDILRYAALAPSGHNTQPWLIEIQGKRSWRLRSQKSRWLPAVDGENHETLLSLGAFLENLSLAAAVHGYNARIRVLIRSLRSAGDAIAEIELESKGGRGEYPLERLELRRTLRTPFQKRELSAADLKAASAYFPDDLMYYPFAGSESRYLDAATLAANESQVGRDAAQAELAEWIRWSDEEARRHRDGLTPESMGITGMAGIFVRNFYDRSSVLSQGFRDQTLQLVREQLAASGGWLAVTSADGSAGALIETGRRFQRMFLIFRERKLALHPMSQALEEGDGMRSVPHELGLSRPVQFLLRVGYVDDYPDAVSLRRAPASFVQFSRS